MQRIKKINFIKGIGLLLILCAILLTFKFIYKQYDNYQETEQIIEQFFPDNISDTLEVEEQEDISIQEILSYPYLGYIELPNYGIKKLIVFGTDRKKLNKGVVGVLETSADLNDEFGNIILAGHNNKNVFGKLHSMKINEPIKIVTHSQTYNFVITEKHTINDDDFSYFNQITDKKILTLVTCQNNNKKRLIVIAELRGL